MAIGSELHQDAYAAARRLRAAPKKKLGSKAQQQPPPRGGPRRALLRPREGPATEAGPKQPEPREPPGEGPVPADTMMCSSIEDFLLPVCDVYRGMQVRRPVTWPEVQLRVDDMAEQDVFGADGTLLLDVPLGRCAGSEEQTRAELSARGSELLATALQLGLPQSISGQVQQDLEEIGMTIVRMLPNIPKLLLKLELMGENSCQRWHQDQYTCRTIVSYNGGRGTDYLDHSNVDWWELKNCGLCERIAINRDEVFSAGIGDILLMKGTKFPSTVNGLVHKSPAKLFHPGGRVVNRLVLKVDVP